MRSNDEHGDQEPSFDILSYRHLTHLLDGFIYYFRENGLNEILSTSKSHSQTKDNDDRKDSELPTTSKDVFFQRSSSTLCLSSLGPDPFQISVADSLPLACRPQLLQSICRKEDLFGRFLYDQTATRYAQVSSQLSLANRERSIPDFLQPNYLNLFPHTKGEGQSIFFDDSPSSNRILFPDVAVDVLLDLSTGFIPGKRSETRFVDFFVNNFVLKTDSFRRRSSTAHSILLNGSYEYLLTRWRFTIELFVKLFLDDVSNEPGSILYESSGFSVREQRFRQEMERLKNMHQKDIRFDAVSERRKSVLLLIDSIFSF